MFLIGSRKYAYRLNFQRAKVPEWVITAMSSIGEKVIGFEDQAEETIDPDYGDVPELVDEYDAVEVNEANRVLERLADLQANFEEEQREEGVYTRARVDPERIKNKVS